MVVRRRGQVPPGASAPPEPRGFCALPGLALRVGGHRAGEGGHGARVGREDAEFAVVARAGDVLLPCGATEIVLDQADMERCAATCYAFVGELDDAAAKRTTSSAKP